MSNVNSPSLSRLTGGTAVLALLAGGLASVDAPPAAADGGSQRVIVEFVGEPALARLDEGQAAALRNGGGTLRSQAREAFRSASQKISHAQDAVLAEAGARGIKLERGRRVTGVLNAAVATVSPEQLDALREVPGVARVSIDHRVHLLETDPVPAPPAPAAPQPTAPDTPAAQAEAGEGSVVAILDTGIDYTLPQLGGGFGEGFKVVGGYDFVNDDEDPMDDQFHGTHVAGIVAGTGEVAGAAPGASLTAYKVMQSDGTGYESTIISGVEAAADPLGENPADVINLSLGGPGDGVDPLAEAASNATESGVLVVAAAGNSGPGDGTVGSPAAAADVLAVGASVTDFRTATASLAAPVQRPLETWRVAFSANAPEGDITAPVVSVGAGTPADFDSAGDVSGKIVAFPAYTAGSPAYYSPEALSISRLAEERGALAAIAYLEPNPEPAGPASAGSVPGVTAVDPSGDGPLAETADSRLPSLVVFGMDAAEYASLEGPVADGSARVSISSVDATDTIASFSSRGPSGRGLLKPELVAPGFQILSTVPAALQVPGNTARFSGTSMAAPYVAGLAAIATAQHPDLDPASLRSLLVGSARELTGASARLSPSVQGAGRADDGALKAAGVLASPAVLGFGHADADRPVSLELALSNLSAEPVTALLEVLPSDVSDGELTLSTSEVAIAAGASATVQAVASATLSDADSELSGVVVARLSNGTEVRVPYLEVSRQLSVTATPQPSIPGTTRVMVSSPLTLDDAPSVTVTSGTGKASTSTASPSPTMPGWFSADMETPEVGGYAVSASSTVGGHSITGSGSLEVVSGATSEHTWVPIGRNASAAQIAVSPAKAGTAMQAAAPSVRPFVTTDHGRSWRQVPSLPVADGTGYPVADPGNGKAFWYAVNGGEARPAHDWSYAGRLLRTEDLGKTWSVLPMPDKRVYSIVNDGSRLAVLTDDGVETSGDGGLTWSHLPFRWPDRALEATLQGGNLLVATGTTVWRVDDVFGSPGAPQAVYTSPEYGFRGITSTPSAVAVTGPVSFAVSTDGGSTWTDSPVQGSSGIDVHAVDNELILTTSGDGYFRSADTGVSWTRSPYPIRGPLATDFARWPDDPKSLLIAMEWGGLFASRDNGGAFQRIAAAATTVSAVIASKDARDRPTLMMADDQGSVSRPLPAERRLPGGTMEWGPTGGEGGYAVRVENLAQDPHEPGTLWRVRSDHSLAHLLEASSDGGSTWARVGSTDFGLQIHDLEASPTTSGSAAASFKNYDDRGLWVTRDGWKHWETHHHPVTIRSVEIDPSDDARIWLAADEGLYVSNDAGRTIRRVHEEGASTVWVDPADPSHIVVGGRGISVSTDGGKTFTRSDVGGIDMYASSITAATVKGKGGDRQVLFAGSTSFSPTPMWVHGRGVLASLDGGATWTNVSAGLASTSVTALDASDDGKWLFVGTRQGGMFRADVAELVRAAG